MRTGMVPWIWETIRSSIATSQAQEQYVHYGLLMWTAITVWIWETIRSSIATSQLQYHRSTAATVTDEVPDEMYSLMNKISPFLGLYLTLKEV